MVSQPAEGRTRTDRGGAATNPRQRGHRRPGRARRSLDQATNPCALLRRLPGEGRAPDTDGHPDADALSSSVSWSHSGPGDTPRTVPGRPEAGTGRPTMDAAMSRSTDRQGPHT